MPTVAGQFARLAEAAIREEQSHIGYLDALLSAEMDERESRAITRLLGEARLLRTKTLDGFEFDRSGVSAAQIRELAGGHYIARAEPVLPIGEAGTGKSHLVTGLCVEACQQRRRVRRRTRLRAARRDRLRADVPGDRRSGREGRRDDYQPAVLGMTAGDP